MDSGRVAPKQKKGMTIFAVTMKTPKPQIYNIEIIAAWRRSRAVGACM
jgi:hypothetical protein